MLRRLALLASLLLLTGCGGFFHPRSAIAPPAPLGDNPLRGDIVPVHDPTLIRQGATWYYITGDVGFLPPGQYLPISCSPDQISWKPCGHIFDTLPGWIHSAVPRAKDLWAPDISYFSGAYHVYYAASRLGSQHSAIGLVTNTTLDPSDPAYRWVDQGIVLSSQRGDDFNAIDPGIFINGDGRVWLTYGSYWSGIKQREIDPASGKLLASNRTIYALASRLNVPEHSLEGASMLRHNGFYYLFASIGLCCEAHIERDTYQQVVGRARSPHGPFVAQAGVSMRRGGGNILLETTGDWLAPGGGSVYLDKQSGNAFLSFHALKRSENGTLYLWIKKIDWLNDWPVLH